MIEWNKRRELGGKGLSVLTVNISAFNRVTIAEGILDDVFYLHYEADKGRDQRAVDY